MMADLIIHGMFIIGPTTSTADIWFIYVLFTTGDKNEY